MLVVPWLAVQAFTRLRKGGLKAPGHVKLLAWNDRVIAAMRRHGPWVRACVKPRPGPSPLSPTSRTRPPSRACSRLSRTAGHTKIWDTILRSGTRAATATPSSRNGAPARRTSETGCARARSPYARGRLCGTRPTSHARLHTGRPLPALPACTGETTRANRGLPVVGLGRTLLPKARA